MLLTGGHGVLQIHPSRRCNLRCAHCYSESGPDVADSLEPALLERAIEDAARLGYRVVSVSGGEPLLYRPLTRVLRAAKAAGMRTSITTNGMQLSRRRLDELTDVLDVLAISLDGRPATHATIRRNAHAFTVLEARLPAVQESRIKFGFISTLTMSNVAEMQFVAEYAQQCGAAFVQIHPLEPEGAAIVNLASAVPDQREQAFALLEGARLSAIHGIPVQVDISRRTDLGSRPDDFLAGPAHPAESLASWLSPLVLETDSTVVPLTYGFPHGYALGRLTDSPLRELAETWDPIPLLGVCRETAERVMREGRVFFNWYEEVCATARAISHSDITRLTSAW